MRPAWINALGAVTAREKERNAACVQRFRERHDVFARDIQIKYRGVQFGLLQCLQRLTDASCRSSDDAAKLEQIFLYQHRYERLILDDKNSQAIQRCISGTIFAGQNHNSREIALRPTWRAQARELGLLI